MTDPTHKMFSDPVTIVTQSQLLMLAESAERSQEALAKIIYKLDEFKLMDDFTEELRQSQKEHGWIIEWIKHMTKDLGTQEVHDQSEDISLQ